MGVIGSTIQLYDAMTPVLRGMDIALNTVISAFSHLQEVSADPMQTAVMEAARQEMIQVGAAAQNMREIMSRAAPVQVDCAQANDQIQIMNNRIAQMQVNLQRAASYPIQLNNTQFVQDMNRIQRQIMGMRESIQRMSGADLSIPGAAAINQQIVDLQNQLEDAAHAQEDLTRALQGTDTAAIGAAYQNLIRTLGLLETQMNNAAAAQQRLQERIRQSPVPPVPPTPPGPPGQPTPATWQTPRALPVIQDYGMNRYRQEIESAQLMMANLAARQEQIARRAQTMQLFSGRATQDMQNMQNRVQSLQTRIDQLARRRISIGGAAQASAQMEALRERMRQAVLAQNEVNAAMRRADLSGANAAYTRMNQLVEQLEQNIRDAGAQQEGLNRRINTGTTGANQLVSTIRRLIGAYMGIRGIGAMINLSDTLSQSSARLGLMNDQLQSNVQLQNMIYQSAQRSRSAYADTAAVVGKLGILAGNAFGSSAEIVQFSELMNKSFKIGGASIQEQTNGMYQLTQAMASGRLQGDEFRSIMENAPMLAQAITDYMGYDDVGDLREASRDGIITAKVIKNAMFKAADDINEKFKSIPMTFGDVWRNITNTAMMAFRPISEKLSGFLNSDRGTALIEGITDALINLAAIGEGVVDLFLAGAGYIQDHWEKIKPVLTAVAVGIGVAMAVAAAASIVAWIAATWPFLLIAALIIGIILLLNKLGFSFRDILTGMAENAAQGYTFAYNLIADLWNFIATFIEFFVNVWEDPLGSIARLFFGLVDVILGLLETVANAIDTVFGGELASAVQGWRSGLSGWVDDTFGEGKVKLDRMEKLDIQDVKELWGDSVGKFFDKVSDAPQNLKKLLDDVGLNDPNNYGPRIDDIAGNTGAIKDSMGILDEDLKYMRDLAEQEAINRFTTAEIRVDMGGITNQIGSHEDVDGIVDYFIGGIYEGASAAAAGVGY